MCLAVAPPYNVWKQCAPAGKQVSQLCLPATLSCASIARLRARRAFLTQFRCVRRASVAAYTSALKSCRHAAAAPHSTIARPLQRGVAAAAVADSKPDNSGPAYPYNSGDSRQQKATLEHIFKPQDHGDVDVEAVAEAAASTSGRVQAPWAVGWQMNERNIMWSDELKLRLIKARCADVVLLACGLHLNLAVAGCAAGSSYHKQQQPG